MSKKNKAKTPTQEVAESIESKLTELIKDVVKQHEIALTEQELREIINELMPDLDHVVSLKIKEHLALLGQFMAEKFGKGDLG